MGTDDKGYELAVCHQLGKAAKLRTGTRFSTDSPPVLGITYASILGIPMRIPMLDIVPSARQVIASRASIHLPHDMPQTGRPATFRRRPGRQLLLAVHDVSRTRQAALLPKILKSATRR
jgi:hypothetical protein